MAVKTITFISPDGKARSVPESDVEKVTAAGWKHAVKMTDPHGKARWVPDADLQKVTDAGWKGADQPEGFFHSLAAQFGMTPEQLQQQQQDRAAHPVIPTLKDIAGGPALSILQGLYEQGKTSIQDIAKAVKDHAQGNNAQATVDATHAIPIMGPAIIKAAGQAPASTGNYAHDLENVITNPGAMGTLVGASAQAAPLVEGGIKKIPGASEALSRVAEPIAAPLSKGAEAMRAAADRFPGAVGRGKNAAMRSLYPKNESLTPHEVAAQNLIKAMVPDEAAVPNIKSAASEVGDAMAAAKRKGTPVNGELDAAKALRDRGAEVQKHYTEKLMRPHSGKFQGVPDNYNGEMSGNGKNQATVGQINDRVDAINRELKSNFRKKLSQQTTEANASDADLNAEKGALTKILHESLGEFNGLDPKEIADVRQRAGKLRSLADEMEASGNKKTVQAGRRESGSTTSPFKSGMESAADKFSGGPEIVGNRAVKGALEGFDATEKPLPEPVLPDPSTTATTPEAAQREFLRAHELEMAAQDAAKSRNAVAEDQRTANTNTQKDIADKEFLQANKLEQSSQDSAAARFKAASDARAGKTTVPASQPQTPKEPTPLPDKAEEPKPTPLEPPTTVIPPSPAPIPLPTPMVDKEVVAADPSRGVKPVNLQVIDATPQSHVFSKTAAKAADPSIDVEAAAKAAAKAGFEVQE